MLLVKELTELLDLCDRRKPYPEAEPVPVVPLECIEEDLELTLFNVLQHESSWLP